MGPGAWREPERALVRICDPAGRPRGHGFAADEHGTVITSHEAVDGLARMVLHAPGERTCLVADDAVTPLPESDLALVRTEGLGLRPLPVTARGAVAVGAYVRVAACGWRQARVLAPAAVTYTATDRFHLLDDALELAIGTDGADALRLGGGAAGGPVVDAATGAVVAVVATALQASHRAAGFAVPLAPAAAADPDGPLARLLERNAATVPGYGRDLNLAGALHLTATSVGSDGPRALDPGPVERPDTAREFARFTGGPAQVLGLVGDPGTGRTTELTALAARRARGAEPAPTLWLRGADLRDADTSVADAVARALERAGRILAASDTTAGGDEGLGDISAGRVARLLRDAGRPLVLLLDGPEEMPPVLAHRLAAWSTGTAGWLRDTGARLVVACRAEYWEEAGAHFPPALLHPPRPDGGTASGADGGAASDAGGGAASDAGGGADAGLVGCVRLGELPEAQARRARARFGIPDGVLADADARHPLALRLLSEVASALPDGPAGQPTRQDVFAAYLDLLGLRVAVRLAAESGLRGRAVRRLAAKVSGQVHEAARRCLGPGQGQLDRAAFEEVFPWGALPGMGFDTCTGWASAVLSEGLLVPAGGGYRFAHEEVGDWVQGLHLDVDGALTSLVLRYAQPGTAVPAPRPLPVPRHRAGPVLQALLQLERQRGAAELGVRLGDLLSALVALSALSASEPPSGTSPEPTPGPPSTPRPTPSSGAEDATWWARYLLRETLLRVPDASPYGDLLQRIAPRREFGPDFWLALRLPEAVRYELLRAVVVHDGPPGTGRRCLDAVAERLAADPAAVQRHLTRWFADERPLRAAPEATVASAAQALLHTHRHHAVDDLTEALIDCAHPRADELLGALTEDEPSALCRAVDRWAHDARPARRIAAAVYAPRAAPHITGEADSRLLRYAAQALLSHSADDALHGVALALLVRDPYSRARHLPRALKRFADGDPSLPASALAVALAGDPEPVLAAFRTRLRTRDTGTGDILRSLAHVTSPALARRVAELVQDQVERCPRAAADAAAYVDLRLERGAAVRDELFPLVAGLLRGRGVDVRVALAPVLAAPGTPVSRPLRGELLDLLLAGEREHPVLEALLRAVGGRGGGAEGDRDLVRRAVLLFGRTPDGATRSDRVLIDLAQRVPGFAARLTTWLTDAPDDWAALVGPSARRTVARSAGAVPVSA
ncbi:trypsin-like peptidase domain-containing protein [Streptomyces sp. NPDC017941]|uniref:trypsin-like peptidase domain-containing protein n=1 Tax=Streptomyces sp. NPDC017941 TaxID=3365018 RepID=UPI00379C58E6